MLRVVVIGGEYHGLMLIVHGKRGCLSMDTQNRTLNMWIENPKPNTKLY